MGLLVVPVMLAVMMAMMTDEFGQPTAPGTPAENRGTVARTLLASGLVLLTWPLLAVAWREYHADKDILLAGHGNRLTVTWRGGVRSRCRTLDIASIRECRVEAGPSLVIALDDDDPIRLPATDYESDEITAFHTDLSQWISAVKGHDTEAAPPEALHQLRERQPS